MLPLLITTPSPAMTPHDNQYTPAEVREALLEELFSVLRPSFYVGVFMGAAVGWMATSQQGVLAGIGTGLLAVPMTTAIGFLLGWCYREGARVFSRTPRIVYGPIWILALQNFVNFCFNMAIGFLKGPFTLVRLLVRLRQLQGS